MPGCILQTSMWRFLHVTAVVSWMSLAVLAQEPVDAYRVSVFAGIGADVRFESITAMWGDGLNLYVADGIAIRRIELSTARITTLARTAATGLHRAASGSIWAYDYSGLYGLWGDGTSLYGSDIGEGSLRKIDLQTGGVQTLATG